MKTIKLSITALLVLAACSPRHFSYEAPSKPVQTDAKHISVAANENYAKVSDRRKFLLGSHFRAEWATPVESEILNLDSATWLTPVKRGGGMQTKSLRLKASDGREYVLRSVNKDPSKALPPELVGTFADEVIQDQISSSNPFAPLVVADLAETAGVLHTTPTMVYIQKASRLGEFNEEFGNTLALLEERPGNGPKLQKGFGGSSHVINSEELFEKLFADPDHIVDQHAYLQARIFDMWIGDWDRHEDQYLWAGYAHRGATHYKPIPRDRDQAFSNLDGVIPTMATRPWAIRQTQHFGFEIKDVYGLTMVGNYLDRMFTHRLTEADWTKQVCEFQATFTDERIHSAFTKMPKEIFELSGNEIIAKLKRRRDDMLAYAMDYYRFLTKDIAVVGTSKREAFTVRRLNNDSTIVTLTRKNTKNDTLYHRVLRTAETTEIKLYGLGGADAFSMLGKVERGPLVRVISGAGKDSIRNEANVSGWSSKLRVYDAERPTIIGTQDLRVTVTGDTLKNAYRKKHFRYDWLAPQITPGFNPDDGLYLGGGIAYKKQVFGKLPYGVMHSLSGNYALRTGAYNFNYKGIFVEAVGKWDLSLKAVIQAPNFVYNFYGYGNETQPVRNDFTYHRARLDQFAFSPSLQRKIGRHEFEAGATYQLMLLEETSGRFVSTEAAGLDSSDFLRKTWGSMHAGYRYQGTDNPVYPRKGYQFAATISETFQLENGDARFAQIKGEIAHYHPMGNAFTLAVRTGASTILGDGYDFYQASTLGGMDNLRGYRRTRFAGKTSLYQNMELRWRVGRSLGATLRGDYGLLAFVDHGRVWIPRESSNTWHSGYGAGFWVLPLNKLSFTVTYAVSPENSIITIKSGFLF